MRTLVALASLLVFNTLLSQRTTTSIEGLVTEDGAPLEYVTVQIIDTELGAITNAQGAYRIDGVPLGEQKIIFKSVGYEKEIRIASIIEKGSSLTIDASMSPSSYMLDQLVVTGTKTFKRQTESPVIVNVMDSKTMESVQACNLSDALRFQTGLRVETDCQTCNYTQLRMNGLGGGYSQILINGRPLFSPLTGLYGMEQIPVNMIDRIETVKGGGSSLYGSSAIGGTVNIITKIPSSSEFDLGMSYQNIDGETSDLILSGNANVLSKSEKSGISIFINNRNRGTYDHNGDNYSELPSLKNNSFGTSLFFKPDDDHKLEISLGSLSEYRYGGEMVDKAAHLAEQSEERRHDVYMASADYQMNFNGDDSSIITYLSGQSTDRTHYTGIIPDDSLAIIDHLTDPPYGISNTTTLQAGVQLNHRIRKFILGDNVFTLGGEFVVDDVFDEIPSYNYLIDQRTENLGMFLQSDWEINTNVNLLSGLRVDKHNLLDKAVLSPRLSLLYKWKKFTQLRLTYSSGFRAPQAFDADLHIAFAGGGISRISLSPELEEERSHSYSASINYDRPMDDMIYGFTIEGFYTQLNDAFYQFALGEDEFGERFEKRNGAGATVQGISLEARGNFSRKLQIEAGFTVQTSSYEEAVQYIEGRPPVARFLRTPDEYGSLIMSFFPESRFNSSISYLYTGEMLLSHFAGAPEQSEDAFVTSESFSEIGVKSSYFLSLDDAGTKLEFFGGVKNLLNSYQDDFDSGKNRDSNYVYGPSNPRTYFIGIRLRS